MATVAIKFKKTNENAVIPSKNHADDTGLESSVDSVRSCQLLTRIPELGLYLIR